MNKLKGTLIAGLAAVSFSSFWLGYFTGTSEPQNIYIFVPAKISETGGCITDSECESQDDEQTQLEVFDA